MLPFGKKDFFLPNTDDVCNTNDDDINLDDDLRGAGLSFSEDQPQSSITELPEDSVTEYSEHSASQSHSHYSEHSQTERSTKESFDKFRQMKSKRNHHHTEDERETKESFEKFKSMKERRSHGHHHSHHKKDKKHKEKKSHKHHDHEKPHNAVIEAFEEPLDTIQEETEKKVRVKPFHKGRYGAANSRWTNDPPPDENQKFVTACNWMICAVICLVVLAIMGCGGFLAYQKYKPSEIGDVYRETSHLRRERNSSDENSQDMTRFDRTDSAKKKRWKGIGAILKKFTFPLWAMPYLMYKNSAVGSAFTMAGSIAMSATGVGAIGIAISLAVGVGLAVSRKVVV